MLGISDECHESCEPFPGSLQNTPVTLNNTLVTNSLKSTLVSLQLALKLLVSFYIGIRDFWSKPRSGSSLAWLDGSHIVNIPLRWEGRKKLRFPCTMDHQYLACRTGGFLLAYQISVLEGNYRHPIPHKMINNPNLPQICYVWHYTSVWHFYSFRVTGRP